MTQSYQTLPESSIYATVPYRYVGNDPAGAVDPSGLEGWYAGSEQGAAGLLASGSRFTPPPRAAGPTTGRGIPVAASQATVATDFQSYPVDRMKALITERWATRSERYPCIVTVSDVVGTEIRTFVFFRDEKTENMPYFPGIGTQGTGEHYYRLVATHGGGQVGDSTRSIDAILASKRTQAWANNCGEAYFAAQRAGAAESLAGAIVFGYPMIPGAAGLLHAADGEWREAAISWSGDAAMVFAGPMAGAVKSARIAKAMRYTGAGIQGVVGGTRTYDALQAWRKGDNIQAAGYLGEAVLRMLGMRKDAIAALRTRVPSSEALMAGARRGGALYGETQLDKLERFLQRRNVTLVRNADAYLDSKGASGLFSAQRHGSSFLFLRSTPTRYEVLHELGHFTDSRRLGFDAYRLLGDVGREQSVYDALRANRNWNVFEQAERDHAFMYILSIGGNPLGQ